MIQAILNENNAKLTLNLRYRDRARGMYAYIPLVHIFNSYGLTKLKNVMDKIAIEGDKVDGITIPVAR